MRSIYLPYGPWDVCVYVCSEKGSQQSYFPFRNLFTNGHGRVPILLVLSSNAELFPETTNRSENLLLDTTICILSSLMYIVSNGCRSCIHGTGDSYDLRLWARPWNLWNCYGRLDLIVLSLSRQRFLDRRR